MKILGLICLFIITSCATHSDRIPVEQSKKNKVLTIEEKKEIVGVMISRHNEFDQATKAKLEKSLIGALDRTQKLKDRESQLIQEILKQSIVKKATFDQMLALKKELKKVYEQKYTNFAKAVTELKDIVGIVPTNQSLSNDLMFDHFFDR